MPDRGSPHRVLTLSPRDNPILIAIATVKEEKIDKEYQKVKNYNPENKHN